jgi:hypothetical protein
MLNLGGTTIGKLMLGATAVSAVYLGSTQVWSAEVDPDAEVAAILAIGDGNMALHASDTSVMWTTTGRTAQVAAQNDPIGSIDSKWGSVTRLFQNVTAADRPLFHASGFMQFDGTDVLGGSGAGTLDFSNEVDAIAGCVLIYPTTISGIHGVVGIGSATANASRNQLQVNSDGSFSLQVRRVDGEVLWSIVSDPGLIIAGNYHIISWEMKYLTGVARLWLNGELLETDTHPGTVGPTSSTNSVRFRIGRTVADSGGFFIGLIGDLVLLRRPFTDDAERITLEAWVANLISEGGAYRAGVGARTFFSNPDLAIYGNLIIIGAAQDDGKTSRYLYFNTTALTAGVCAITPIAAGDDHDQPVMIQLASGDWLAASTGHNVAALHIGRGPTPFDLTWTNIDAQLGSDDYSYIYLAQLHGLSGQPIVLIGRTGEAGAWRIRYTISLDEGVTWSTYTSFLISNAGDDRPYIQTAKNAAGTRLYFSATDGLPSEFDPNSVYSGYYGLPPGGTDPDDVGFYKTEDNSLVVTTGGVAPSAFSLAFNATAENDAWNWDMEIIGDYLALAIATFPTTSNHRYRRLLMPLTTGVWDDEIVVSDAGGLLITPSNYSGGVCFHPTNKDIMFASISDPAVESGVHQIYRMERISAGNWVRAERLTSGSVPSFRPEAIGNVLTFVRGPYGPTYFDFAGCHIMVLLI